MTDRIIPLQGRAKDPITGMRLGTPGLKKARNRVVRNFNRWLKTDKKLTEAPTEGKRIASLFNEFVAVREQVERPRVQEMRKQKSAASKRRGG